MQIDQERIEKYLDEIVSETLDLEAVLMRSDDEILKDRHVVKSFKYSVIVIAEAMASALQHILAKQYNVAVDGYTQVFVKTKENRILSEEFLARLQPFIAFRNMLVHQYWRVDDRIFLKNLRNGLRDFRVFVKEIRQKTIS